MMTPSGIIDIYIVGCVSEFKVLGLSSTLKYKIMVNKTLDHHMIVDPVIFNY